MVVDFAGIKFTGLKKERLLTIDDHLKFVVTLNAEHIVYANENATFRRLIDGAICTFDGQIPYALAKISNRKIDFEKISGSDFIYDACEEASNRNQKIFLLGGREKANALSCERLRELFPDLQIEGYSPEFAPYPFKEEVMATIKNKIATFKPTYVFVGFGIFKQEKWISDHYEFMDSVGVKLAVGTGGTFEFVSGLIPRAPKWMQKIGMESVYRLFMEPKYFRIKRILKSCKVFLYSK